MSPREISVRYLAPLNESMITVRNNNTRHEMRFRATDFIAKLSRLPDDLTETQGSKEPAKSNPKDMEIKENRSPEIMSAINITETHPISPRRYRKRYLTTKSAAISVNIPPLSYPRSLKATRKMHHVLLCS